jgi:hypothetical protein
MSKMIVDKVKLKAIANAVRFKDGSANTMHLPEIPDRIKAIPQSMGDGLVSMAFPARHLYRLIISAQSKCHPVRWRCHLPESMCRQSFMLPLILNCHTHYVIYRTGGVELCF